MKRWIFWSFVSVATFMVGTLLVYVYLTLTAPIFTAERVIVSSATEVLPASQEPISLEEEFNAEIIDIVYSDLGLDREPDFDFNNIIESGKLEVSSYFTDIKRGEKKFVMFDDNGRYSIRRSSAVFRSRKVKNAEYDLIKIGFKGTGKSVFIFPELSFLKSRAIKTLYLRPTQSEIDRRSLPIGYSLRRDEKRLFALDKDYYTFRITKGRASDGRNLDILILEKDNDRQVIDATEYYGESDEGFADVVWAGDLDNDGKLDLITHGTQGIMLYVSSKAEKGKFVKLVSTGGVEGC